MTENDVMSTTALDGKGWRPTIKDTGTPLLLLLLLRLLLVVVLFMQGGSLFMTTTLTLRFGMHKVFLMPFLRRRVGGILEG